MISSIVRELRNILKITIFKRPPESDVRSKTTGEII
jgi:hypothetical protein